MKKLLVTLLLGAGLVSVASALEPLDCTNNTTNKCCVDVHSIEDAIQKSTTKSIKTTDGYTVLIPEQDLTDDGIDYSNCVDKLLYVDFNNKQQRAYFTWTPGSWVSTIKFDGPDLSAK